MDGKTTMARMNLDGEDCLAVFVRTMLAVILVQVTLLLQDPMEDGGHPLETTKVLFGTGCMITTTVYRSIHGKPCF